MDSKQDEWSPEEQPVRRSHCFTMTSVAIEPTLSYISQPSEDASVPAGEIPAAMEMAQVGQIAGGPAGSQVVQYVVPQYMGVQSPVGQVMGEDAYVPAGEIPAAMETAQEGQIAGGPAGSQVPQDKGSDNLLAYLLAAAKDIEDRMPRSEDMEEEPAPQGPIGRHYLAPVSQEYEMMGNEKNAQLEAELEDAMKDLL